MKRIVYLMFWFSTALFFSCEEEWKFSQKAIVQAYDSNCARYLVEGARLKMYRSYEDYLLKQNPVLDGVTDVNGEIKLPVKMEDYVWLEVTKDDMSNTRYDSYIPENGISMNASSVPVLIGQPVAPLKLNLKNQQGQPIGDIFDEYTIYYYFSQEDFDNDVLLHESPLAVSTLFCEDVESKFRITIDHSHSRFVGESSIPERFVIGSTIWFRVAEDLGSATITKEKGDFLTTSISKVTLSSNPDVINSYDVFVTQ